MESMDGFYAFSILILDLIAGGHWVVGAVMVHGSDPVVVGLQLLDLVELLLSVLFVIDHLSVNGLIFLSLHLFVLLLKL